jgi:hypothetical protein
MKIIGRVMKRTFKTEFGKRKNPLPKKLSFLSYVPFYAVTECKPPDSHIRQTRIEILPSSLKKISGSYQKYKELKKDHKQLLNKLEEAKSVSEEQKKRIKALEKTNSQLLINLGEGPDTPKPQIKSYLQVAEETGFISRGRPLQGGIPSLGKKR